MEEQRQRTNRCCFEGCGLVKEGGKARPCKRVEWKDKKLSKTQYHQFFDYYCDDHKQELCMYNFLDEDDIERVQ